MKAVNLIPADARRGRGVQVGSLPQGPAAVVLGLLAVALALVTVYVLTENSITDRKATLASDQAQLTAVTAEAAKLTQYSQFAQLAQARIQTIREIADTRFDWQASLADLSKVVPADTSLQSLVGTVSPGAGAGGGGGATAGASSGSLRSAIPNPAIQLSGCTKTQDDVARLMSRLRLMDGVIRVTLADSQKSVNAQAGASVASGSTQGCGPNTPTFDLVVFFKPLPAAASTATPSAAGSSTATTVAGSTTTAATTPAVTSTTSQTITTSTTPSPASSAGSGASR